MKLVKSLLLGSAAGLCAVAGAQAADLPMRKAAPVEYVRVCTAYGAGFFYIPGTDTCLRVGGRARFEYQYTSQRNRGSSDSGYRGLGRLNIDARTQTSYGTLRAFVRFDIASRSGGYLKSGTQERFANSFSGTGVDTNQQLQKFVDVDKAFIQFAGITAGRAQSFFDFYAHDLELIGSSLGSDTNTNLFAYTATFGGGFSATVSAEDPTYRRNPVFFNATSGQVGLVAGTAPSVQAGVGFANGAFPLAFLATGYNAGGVPVLAQAIDSGQKNNMPDFIVNGRYDAAWGAAQISGGVHEIKIGSLQPGFGNFAVNGGGVAATVQAATIPSAAYGFGVQGGLKFNVPQIAPGDVLWLQAAYAQGASSFTGAFSPPGLDSLNGGAYTNRFSGLTQADAYINARNRLILSETYSGTIAFLHYWTPEIRQGVFASVAMIDYGRNARTFGGAVGGTATVRSAFDPTLKSYTDTFVGSNLIWSPVRDLDIGVEVVYERLDVRGRVFDANKGGTLAGATAGAAGPTGRTIGVDDQILARMRVQRDF